MMIKNIEEQVIEVLQISGLFSLQVDESTAISRKAPLMAFKLAPPHCLVSSKPSLKICYFFTKIYNRVFNISNSILFPGERLLCERACTLHCRINTKSVPKFCYLFATICNSIIFPGKRFFCKGAKYIKILK